jgi:hypothetical protein
VRSEIAASQLLRFEKTDLVSVRLERPGLNLSLERRQGDHWIATGQSWRVRASTIRRIVHQTHDLMARSRVLSPAEPAHYGLEDAIVVELGLRGGGRHVLRVGDPTPSAISHYVQVAGVEGTFTVQRAAVDVFASPLDGFRENRFAAFEADDAVALRFEAEGRAMAFARVGDAWEMVEPHRLPASRDAVRSMLGRVSVLKALAFVEPGGSALEGGEQVVVSLEDGSRVSVRFGALVPNSDPHQRLVQDEVDGSLYRVRGGDLAAFRLPLEDYRDRSIVGRHGWDVVRMEVGFPGGDAVELHRTADGWAWADGTPVAGSTPKRVADRGAGLRATAFLDEAPPRVVADATILSLYFEDGEQSVLELSRPQEEDGARQVVVVPGRAAAYEVDEGLSEVLEDVRREHGRKIARDGARRRKP